MKQALVRSVLVFSLTGGWMASGCLREVEFEPSDTDNLEEDVVDAADSDTGGMSQGRDTRAISDSGMGMETGRDMDSTGDAGENDGSADVRNQDTCVPVAEKETQCDGRDDNCNGQTDEGLVKSCSKTKGVCKGGMITCSGGEFSACGKAQYGQEYEASEMSCDGKDNDCDGVIDAGAECTWNLLLGSSAPDEIVDVEVHPTKGTIYVTGVTAGRLAGHSPSGEDDVFLAAYAPTGNQLWIEFLATPKADGVVGLEWREKDDALLVAGHTGGDLGGNSSPSGGSYVAKFDENGHRKWVETFGEISFGLFEVASDSGEMYIADQAYESVKGSNAPKGLSDVVVVKLDEHARFSWVRLLSGAGAMDQPTALLVEPKTANLYVIGSVDGGMESGKQIGYEDGFIAKVAPDGSLKWVEMFGSPDRDYVSAAARDPGSGQIFVVGWTTGDIGGRKRPGGYGDTYIGAFDSKGKSQWYDIVGSSGIERGGGIGLDIPEQRVVISGRTDMKIAGQGGFGGNDVFTATYNWSGRRLSLNVVGSKENDSPGPVAFDPRHGDVYATGLTTGDIWGQGANGKRDGFVFRVR